MIGAQIKAARGLLNWSVRELGKKAGVHWNTVSAIELGKSGGRPETLKAIQKALERGGVEFTNGKRPGVRLRKRCNSARCWRKQFCPLFTGRRTSRQYRFDYTVIRKCRDSFDGRLGWQRKAAQPLAGRAAKWLLEEIEL